MTEPGFQDARILVVDDEASNVRALRRILAAAGYRAVTATTDPTTVAALWAKQEPDLMLLDYHMPVMDGLAVLRQVRAAGGAGSYVPVVVLTGDDSRTARRDALTAGASDFITKPFEMDEVLLRIRNLLETRALHRGLTLQNQLLESRVAERTAELEDANLDSLERLGLAAEFRDDDTGRHTERVGEASAVLAAALRLPAEQVFLVRRAAPLHDVGKIGIPDAVLRKPGPLSQDERSLMEQHAGIGARILSRGRSLVIRLAEEIAGSHHEQWDGSGYPAGLAGESIPLHGRLVMVADVFDALSSDRVYRPAWTLERVFDYIREHAGRRFDPAVSRLCEASQVREALMAVKARGHAPR